jgi:hypothetical protein
MIIDRFGFGPHSEVIELASNDGYLVQWFVKAGVPSLGIEPAAHVAAAAEEKGVSTLVRFFGVESRTCSSTPAFRAPPGDVRPGRLIKFVVG